MWASSPEESPDMSPAALELLSDPRAAAWLRDGTVGRMGEGRVVEGRVVVGRVVVGRGLEGRVVEGRVAASAGSTDHRVTTS